MAWGWYTGHEESLRELSLFSPERTQLEEDFAAYNYLIRGYRKDGSSLLRDVQ